MQIEAEQRKGNQAIFQDAMNNSWVLIHYNFNSWSYCTSIHLLQTKALVSVKKYLLDSSCVQSAVDYLFYNILSLPVLIKVLQISQGQ